MAATSEFILAVVDQRVNARSDVLLSRLDLIATALWSQNSHDFDELWQDWLVTGLNTWPGYIAQYWLNRIRLRWRTSDDDWSGLTQIESTAIASLLDASSPASPPAVALVARDVYFLFAADADFTREHVFPLFSETSSRGNQAWASYLHNPRVSFEMIDGGFLQVMLGGRAHADALEKEHLEQQYWQLLARVAADAPPESIDRVHLITELVASGDAVMSNFVRALGDAIEDTAPESLDNSWTVWLSEILRHRSNSRPQAIMPEEKSAWGDFALQANQLAPVVMEALERIPGRLTDRTNFDSLPEGVLAANVNTVANYVLVRLRVTERSDWRIQHELANVFRRLKNVGAPLEVQQAIVEEAIRIGIPDAVRWL